VIFFLIHLQTERSVFLKIMKETKEIILKTAYDMFLNNNYEAVTINNIIKAAGITKGGIYHYYASKEELFKAVIDKFMIENRRVMPEIEHSNLSEMVEYTISKMLEHNQRKNKGIEVDPNLPAQQISLFMAAFKYYPGFTKIGSKFYHSEVERWKKVIDLAIKNGEVRNNVDSELTALNFMVIGTNIVTNTLLGGSIEFAIEMYAKQLRELYKSIKV